ncbi:hypothetical protein [Actinoplanes sp. NPDC026623]|uniref:alpha/beta hydrolase n=1 Tax=Actinoplanes sp. NPDC026623 TaxID=3155610 RepID=UPI0033D7448A
MRRRLLVSALAGLLLAGAMMLLLPRFGETGGRRQTFSPVLPAPTGPYDVGVRRMLLTDTARSDPWRPDEHRTVMLDVHYPAAAGRTPLAYYAVAQDMTELGSLAWAPGEERRLGLRPDDVNWMFRTHAHEWAPPAAGSFPVLIGSAPPGVMRTAYGGIAEELASHGYAVVTVDHPYDAPVVELFPTRRVIRPSGATRTPNRAAADAARAADIGSVLRRLDRLDPELRATVDLRRVGLFGWAGTSRGTLAALAALPGVSAMASIGVAPYARAGPADPPALVIGDEPDSGPARRATVSVPGATARAFTDDGVILAQVAARYPATAARVRQDVGEVQPLAYRTVRRYLVAFFDVRLRNVPPVPSLPEPGVTVQPVAP